VDFKAGFSAGANFGFAIKPTLPDSDIPGGKRAIGNSVNRRWR
jgi:hypothetical protein